MDSRWDWYNTDGEITVLLVNIDKLINLNDDVQMQRLSLLNLFQHILYSRKIIVLAITCSTHW